ncbi:TetR/AcrR family transcriptional regulator [Nocardia sp. NPDC059228]|uniref:TetR/AcrR family transcriptional regulator n=1 Tax=Nocardia sp. NPDC059228 TaxID=3346777 RepID=UPI0036CDA880
MARTAGSRNVPRAEREEQILDAAAAQIARVGYAGLSMAAVAKQAGVSKTLVHTCFDTRDGLYAACLDRAARAVTEAVEPVLSGTADLTMAEQTLLAIFGALEHRPHDWNVLLDRTHPAAGPAAEAANAARARIEEQAARAMSAFMAARAITDPVDLAAFTEVWIGAVTALIHWWQRHPQVPGPELAARTRRVIAAFA